MIQQDPKEAKPFFPDTLGGKKLHNRNTGAEDGH